MKINNDPIDKYINLATHQERLKILDRLIMSKIPSAERTISYQMPCYRTTHNIIYIAEFKDHIGIYPGPRVVSELESKLLGKKIKFSKGTIKINHNDTLDLSLIEEIINLALVFNQ